MLPAIGVGFALCFAGNTPLKVLGPSIVIGSPPFSTGYAIHAYRRAAATAPASIGLALAAIESLALVVLLIIAFSAGGGE